MNASRIVLGGLGLCAALGLNAMGQGEASTAAERANELQSRYMTTVRAELTSKLDTKTAAAGQVLTARTEAAITLADGTAIPAGTKLVGRVVDVHPKTDDRAESAVTVTFDRAEMKDGKTLPVRSLIRGMYTAGAPAAAGPDPSANGRGRSSGSMGPVGTNPGSMGTDPMGGLGGDPGMGGTAGSPNGGMGGGGMGGGGMGGGRTGNGTGTGGIGGTTRGGRQVPMQPQVNSIPDAAAANPVASTAEGGETVRVAPKPTGVPGVLLYANPASDVSGMLMEYDRNIHLDSGVQLTLGVISRQPAAADPTVK